MSDSRESDDEELQAGTPVSWIERGLMEGETCPDCKRGPLVSYEEEVENCFKQFLYCPKCGEDFKDFATGE